MSKSLLKASNEHDSLKAEIDDFSVFKKQLMAELRQEMRFRGDIFKITIKYKRLIADQRKDKERIV